MDPKLIRDARRRKGMTQVALGKIVGVSGSQICKVEVGTRILRVDEAERLASALGIPLSEVPIKGEGPAEPVPVSSSKTSKSMLALSEGTAIVEFPAALSVYSREKLEQWLELIRDLVSHENL